MTTPETIGHEPTRARLPGSPWAVASVAVAVAVVLGVVALHYRAEVKVEAHPAPTKHQAVELSFPPPAPLHMGTQVHRVHGGGLSMAVRFTSAIDESQRRSHGQVEVSATVTGAPAGARLRLEGGDCITDANRVWATGVADQAGRAYLTGPIWTLCSSHEYYLELVPWRVARRVPGLNGVWLGGLIQPFFAGASPCL